MSLINQVATFKGAILEKAINITKNGFPQLVLSLQAIELYDEDAQEWVDWSDEEHKNITAHLVLFGGNGEFTLSAKQVMKVFGWSGESFQELEELEIGDPIQFRTAENLYEDKTSIQVAWIDEYDAEPGRTLRKLDIDEIKKLDAKFAPGLRKLSGGPKPKSVPAKAPKSKVEKPKAEKPKTTKKEEPKSVTVDEAWEVCCKRKPEDITEAKLADVWLEQVEAMGSDEKVEADGQWGELCHRVLETIGAEDSIPF